MRNIIAGLALAISSLAHAGEFYGMFGGGIGNAGFGSSFSNRIGAGWMDGDLSFEAAYLHFGKDGEIDRRHTVVGNIRTTDTHQTSAEAGGVALSATLGRQLGPTKPYVRLGTLVDLSSFSDTMEQLIVDQSTMTVIGRSLTSSKESARGRLRLLTGFGVTIHLFSLEYVRAENVGQDRHADAINLLVRMPLE